MADPYHQDGEMNIFDRVDDAIVSATDAKQVGFALQLPCAWRMLSDR